MGLEREIESKKSEDEKKNSEKKDHEKKFELSNKASNDVTMEDLKHTPFPHRLAKMSKANLNAKIYDVFKQVRINIPMLGAIK